MDQAETLLSVRISAEWRTGPLWVTTSGDRFEDNAEPEDLAEKFGVSVELVAELNEWDDEFQQIWDPADPASAEFPSEEAEVRWEERGRRLAEKLAAELGPTVRVSYYKEIIQAGATDREREDD
ncbi:hypothetical protein [Saccharopolyspora sp. ASAGF58]|uniref:hypothetical protein n=1 Tax=Saccharopolyspora sp. ASAGF58 TaxID=2719023 RepID=UPI0014401E5E|nr:hypothetical protein [Saccharopolyspora sp. ASAGF58]QIZ35896.1 hypothetical protein FDZ84_15860 [Saccharopolyspora sp. ASAGF58]